MITTRSRQPSIDDYVHININTANGLTYDLLFATQIHVQLRGRKVQQWKVEQVQRTFTPCPRTYAISMHTVHTNDPWKTWSHIYNTFSIVCGGAREGKGAHARDVTCRTLKGRAPIYRGWCDACVLCLPIFSLSCCHINPLDTVASVNLPPV